MVVVAIAGGSGKLGSAIVDVLVERGKHEVIVLTREVWVLPPFDEFLELRHERWAKQKSNTGEYEGGQTTVSVQYDNVQSLTDTLESRKVEVLISTLDPQSGLDPELNLIKAADASLTTKRYIPSLWGIKYTPETAEISPIARTKLVFYDALNKTSLEWTAFANGYFLDYYLAPHVKTYMPPTALAIDVQNATAAITGTGDVPVVFTYNFDIARFVAAALGLPKWDKTSYVIGDRVTLNEFLSIVEEARGVRFSVVKDSLEDLKAGRVTELPSHPPLYPFFPKPHLQSLFASFERLFEEGHFDMKPETSLNDVFPDIKTKTVRDGLLEAWKRG
ncbi:Putative NmrA-like domain, NAD(P)-binding domain superfamily [Colletotrichum destructivum]|uniref:NmrA-like domain, NAD(P)-binding domain superfamily n=1 Tax=Colletotrichum destructivum TaxID=34406 RepID=A0AAX4IKS5_9PEZI|nr:Putative NmrA-like domain, NAD(P)-binding domain superfamily [Colletotrichum destructivum]